MTGTGYKLIGYAVWNGGKWYLQRRLAVRRIAVKGAAALLGLAGVGLLARRLVGRLSP
jgi:hypothetical protein